MATYIKGLTDVIPQIPPFQPDFNLIQKTLATRQNRYDQGFAVLNNTYSQVLSALFLMQQTGLFVISFYSRHRID